MRSERSSSFWNATTFAEPSISQALTLLRINNLQAYSARFSIVRLLSRCLNSLYRCCSAKWVTNSFYQAHASNQNALSTRVSHSNTPISNPLSNTPLRGLPVDPSPFLLHFRVYEDKASAATRNLCIHVARFDRDRRIPALIPVYRLKHSGRRRIASVDHTDVPPTAIRTRTI